MNDSTLYFSLYTFNSFSQVGHGLKNGLYKLTVTVPADPPETAFLTVGDLSVAVTNAGDYVFLLWKGARYPLAVFPHDFTNCVYSAVDDVQPTRSQEWPVFGDRRWTEERGALELVVPLFPLVPFSTNDCHVLWKPSLSVSPSTWQPFGMNATETFMAMLDDAPSFAYKTFHWTTSDSSAVSIESPAAPVTRMTAHSPDIDGVSLSLAVTVLDCTLHSYFDPEYIDLDEEAYLTVEASPSVVFFEKDTANTESAALTCRYKVNTSGTFSLSMSDGACTVKDSEFNDVQPGYSWYVDEPSSGARHFTVYNSIRSSSASGTVFTVTFTPDEGAGAMSAAASVTFVEWETRTAEKPLPRNRKKIGLREWVFVKFNPLLGNANATTLMRGSTIARCKGSASSWVYHAPTSNGTDNVTFSFDDCALTIPFVVCEPVGYEVALTNITYYEGAGVSGDFKMLFSLKLVPTDVSFRALDIQEEGLVATNATGYFLNPAYTNLLDHAKHGAEQSKWIEVAGDQVMGDEAGCASFPYPWDGGGSFTWPIPNYYRIRNSKTFFRKFCDTDQVFELDADGTVRIKKFGYVGECHTNRVVTYRMEAQQ